MECEASLTKKAVSRQELQADHCFWCPNLFVHVGGRLRPEKRVSQPSRKRQSDIVSWIFRNLVQVVLWTRECVYWHGKPFRITQRKALSCSSSVKLFHGFRIIALQIFIFQCTDKFASPFSAVCGLDRCAHQCRHWKQWTADTDIAEIASEWSKIEAAAGSAHSWNVLQIILLRTVE